MTVTQCSLTPSESPHEPCSTTVWVIDVQHWPRAYLRAELIERGFDAIGYECITDALEDLRRSSTRRPRVIIVEASGQPLKKIEIEGLVRAGIDLVAIAGHAEMNDPVFQRVPWKAVMKRPTTIGEIADKAMQLAGLGSSK